MIGRLRNSRDKMNIRVVRGGNGMMKLKELRRKTIVKTKSYKN